MSMRAVDMVKAISACVNPSRVKKMKEVLSRRVADTALVFENIVDTHNVSACLRTADALGIQQVHVIERWADAFISHRGIDKGAAQWLSINRWRTSKDCVAALRHDGFRIFATDLGGGAVTMDAAIQQSLTTTASYPCEGTQPRPRVALVFGNEHRGCSRSLLEHADVRFYIPHLGFVQSMNLSVAAGIVAASFLHRTPDYAALQSSAIGAANAAQASPSGPLHCELLSEDRQNEILARWLVNTVANADKILGRAECKPEDL